MDKKVGKTEEISISFSVPVGGYCRRKIMKDRYINEQIQCEWLDEHRITCSIFGCALAYTSPIANICKCEECIISKKGD